MTPSRLSEIAFVLPWLGAFLLTPPIIMVVQNWSRASGLPLFHIYLFACWAALIVLARALSVRLAAKYAGARHSPASPVERAD